jgi:predicted CXXCH cytochrome family protein
VKRRQRTILISGICMLLLVPVFSLAGIRETKHNLSVSGPGPVKAVSETEICIFCHTPHNASPSTPLWSHAPSTAVSYVNYWNPTLKSYSSQAGAPPIDGFSKLCLGCHDGTVAFGAVLSRKQDIQMVPVGGVVDAAGKLLPGASGYIGTDHLSGGVHSLAGGHPISIRYDLSLVNRRNSDPFLMPLKWPMTDPDVKLYPTQGGYGVQCTSCHEPHGAKGSGWPPLWQKPSFDEVCLACHEI